MDEACELKCHNLEKNYWWFKTRRDIIYKLIYGMDQNSKILDIGCSSGILIEYLKQKGFNNIYGIDKSKKSIDLGKKRNIKNVFVMDGTKTKFNNEEFDIIIASDVLEHIKDDNLTLLEWNRILKYDGKLILFVPAFKFLWSEHDEIAHHYKRYSKSTLTEILKRTNFEINKSSYWNFCLFFPIFLLRNFQCFFLKSRIKKSDQLYKLNFFTNNFFIYLLKFENYMLSKINFPFGISVFAIATKRR